MSRRQRMAVAATVVAVIAALAVARLRAPADEVSGSFCQLYPNISKMTAMLERGLEGHARSDDLLPADVRATSALVWSDHVAEGGPDEVDADAVRIATAVRAAAADEDPAPLGEPAVRRAIERVEPIAREACSRDDG